MKNSRCLFALLAFLTGTVTALAQTAYTANTTVSSDTPLGQALVVANAATLTITNGATLSTGTANNATIGVDLGAGSTDGTLAITGGTLSDGGGYIGQAASSHGTATLGANSTWTNSGNLVVGSLGTGVLMASAGATLTSSAGIVGGNTGATGTVTLTGSGTDWTSGGIHFGENGNATLILADGASIHVGTLKLGNQVGSMGTASVSGPGTTVTTTELDVGYYGTGTLTVSTGAIINVGSGGSSANLGPGGGSGTINFGADAASPAAAAGVLNATSVNGPGILQFNTTGTAGAPTYFTKDGTALGTGMNTNGTFALIHTAGTTVFTGTLVHSGPTTLNGGTAIFNGSVSASAVTVNDGATLGGHGTFGAGLTLNDGAELEFQLGQTDHDLMAVTGGLLTGPTTGSITINLFDSGDFAAGTYDLLDYAHLAPGTLTTDMFTLGSVIPGYDYAFNDSGSAFQLIATTSAVPEPATCAALAGLAVLALAARRKK